MSKIRSMAALIFTVAVLPVLMRPTRATAQEEIQRVRVTNFPELQKVAGVVSIEGTVRHAEQQRFKDILVSPVDPEQTGRLVSAGTLAADGFTSVVLGLSGRSRGIMLRPGTVGAILIPEEEQVLRAFEDDGKIQIPIEITAPTLPGSSPYFASKPEKSVVGFPRYRVLLYNTSDRPVTVTLYAYLTY